MGKAVIPEADGIYPDISDLIYHQDRGSLSSSGARKLLPPSCPAIFRHAQDNPPESSTAFDIGKAAHTMILGAGQEIGPVPFDDWRSKAAQQARESARADGWIPLLQADYQSVCVMSRALHARHIVVAPLFSNR